jgi:tRNA A-37 threonylcarbamoyl transferase component Bud32
MGHGVFWCSSPEVASHYCQRELQRDSRVTALLMTTGPLPMKEPTKLQSRVLIAQLLMNQWPSSLHFVVAVLDRSEERLETVTVSAGREVSFGLGVARTSDEVAENVVDAVAELIARLHDAESPGAVSQSGFQLLPSGTKVRGELDTYYVMELVGRGGTAEVYEVMATNGDRAAAKLLSGHRFEITGEMRTRFRKEISNLRSIDDDHVLRVVDEASYLDEPVLVAEYIAGSVHDRLKPGSGAIPLPTILKWSQAVLGALSVLHRNNIVHRDISPKNLLLRSDDSIVLADFGTARNLLDETITRENEPIGSMLYISTQQFEDPHGAVPADDVYSVGQVIWELASGRRPFGNTPPLAQLKPELPADLVRLLDWMRAHERRDRPSADTALKGMREIEADAHR